LPVSETPRFRRFEPQAPFPRDVFTGKLRYNHHSGPSGNPLLDSKKLRGKVASVNNELIKPIDFDLLNTDFDFDANLEQFKKEDFDDEYYETVEKQKISQNFAHYENIIDDPDRCISWTNMCGSNGIIGQVDASGKAAPERFVLLECCTLFGPDVFYYLVADRLIIFSISLDNVVVLASRSTSSRLIDRILFHLDNRGYRSSSFLI
uniref:FDF domain-containing protein n=1 Tax=Angiostrongylus cantonensis TaxID=6313 RepID=A0A0K0CYT0_ANGCA